MFLLRAARCLWLMMTGGFIQSHLTAGSAHPVMVSGGSWNKPSAMPRNESFYLKKVDGGRVRARISSFWSHLVHRETLRSQKPLGAVASVANAECQWGVEADRKGRWAFSCESSNLVWNKSVCVCQQQWLAVFQAEGQACAKPGIGKLSVEWWPLEERRVRTQVPQKGKSGAIRRTIIIQSWSVETHQPSPWGLI